MVIKREERDKMYKEIYENKNIKRTVNHDFDKSISSFSTAKFQNATSNLTLKSTSKFEKISGVNHLSIGRATPNDDISNMSTSIQSMNKNQSKLNIDVIRMDRESSMARLRKRNRRATLSPLDIDRGRENVQPRKMRRRNIVKRRTWWLISADSRFKISWDIMTALISICSILCMNRAIQTKSYEKSLFGLFCECWFFIDICLNFVTEYRPISGDVISDGKAVWAQYLTTWFPIDALSLIPWERFFVKPIVDMQRKRGFLKKSFFRTKSIVRVTRKLRRGHFKLFGKVASTSKLAGVGGRKLLTYIIKYVPKYVMFYRNMKGVLAVRMLRQIHWLLKLLRDVWVCTKKLRPSYPDNTITTGNPQDDCDDKVHQSEEYANKLTKIKDIRPFSRKSKRAVSTESTLASFRDGALDDVPSLSSWNSKSFDEYESEPKRPPDRIKEFRYQHVNEEEDFGFGLY